jgi:plasmid replication initiation protein
LLNSVYSIRLYELLIQWKSVGKTPVFEIDQFRAQLGVAANEYPAMGNFKRRVLDLAVNEVSEKTNIIVEYDQLKTGKTITGFRFKFKFKTKNDNPVQDENKEYLICNLTDSQIITFSEKLAKHDGFKKFGNRGEEDNNFIKRIQLMLRKMDLDIELSKRITPYLKELDFKPTSKNLISLDDLIYKINENNKSNNNFNNDDGIKDKENELILKTT